MFTQILQMASPVHYRISIHTFELRKTTLLDANVNSVKNGSPYLVSVRGLSNVGVSGKNVVIKTWSYESVENVSEITLFDKKKH